MSSSGKRWVFLLLPTSVIVLSLAYALVMIGFFLEPVISDVIDVDPVSWRMVRPTGHVDLDETVVNVYSTESAILKLSLFIKRYAENRTRGEWDSLVIYVNATVDVSGGFVYSASITFSYDDEHALLNIFEDPHFIHLHNFVLQEVSDWPQETFIKVLGEKEESYCSLRSQADWRFADQNIVDHKALITMDVTWFNGTEFLETVIPIQLEVLEHSLTPDTFMIYEQFFVWDGESVVDYMMWNITCLRDGYVDLSLVSHGVNVTNGDVELTLGVANLTIDKASREVINCSEIIEYYVGEKWPFWIETNVTFGSTVDIWYGANTISEDETVYVLGRRRECWVIEYNWTSGSMKRWFDKTSGLLLKIHNVLYRQGTTIVVIETAVMTNVDLY